jgi:hypothetical protein
MGDTRCDLTDLLVEQCACRQHRAGRTVEEEAAREQHAHRARLLAGPGWFPAQFPGRCGQCGHGFEAGTALRLPSPLPLGWLAECCSDTPAGGVR